MAVGGQRIPTAQRPLELAVVDDNALLRRTLIRLVGRQPELTMIAEAACGEEMAALLAEREPELLLLEQLARLGAAPAPVLR